MTTLCFIGQMGASGFGLETLLAWLQEVTTQGPDNIEAITTVTYVFFIYLLLALLVERSVEILVAVYKYVELKRDWFRFFERKAARYRQRFERLYGFQGEQASRARSVLNRVYWRVLIEPATPGSRPVVSAVLVRLSYLRLGTRLVSILLALLLVLVLLNFAEFNLLDLIAQFYAQNFQGAALLRKITSSPALSVLISAIFISLGVEPLHKLIARVEDLGKPKTQPALQGGAA